MEMVEVDTEGGEVRRVLGTDAKGVKVYVMEGRFGAYVQLGDAVQAAIALVESRLRTR